MTYIPCEVRNDGPEAATDMVALVGVPQGKQMFEGTTIDITILASHGIVEGEVVTALDLIAHTVETPISALQLP